MTTQRNMITVIKIKRLKDRSSKRIVNMQISHRYTMDYLFLWLVSEREKIQLHLLYHGLFKMIYRYYETEPSLYEDLILSAEKHQVSLSDLWFNTSTMKYYLQLLVETIQTMCTSLHGVCIRQIITTNIYISCLCTHVFIIFHAIFQKSIIQKIKINQTPELKFSISQNFSANMGYYFWQ